MTRLEHVQNVYDKEIEKIKQPELWQHTLENIARYYKFSFTEAILINAQAENVSIMATMHDWNRFGKHIRRGERSIAVFTSRTDTALKYLFDISQTYGPSIEKSWNIKESADQREKLIRRYNSKYGTDYTELSGVINSVYRSAMESILEDIEREISIFEYQNEAEIKKFISDSAFCIIMTRCGYEIPSDTLDFSSVSEIIPDGLLITAGNLSMKAAHNALMEIENAIRRKDYEQYQIQGHSAGVRGEERSALSEIESAQEQGGVEYKSEESDRYAERTQPLGIGRGEYERIGRTDMGRDSRQSGREGGRNNEGYVEEPAQELGRTGASAGGNTIGSAAAGERAYAGISSSAEESGDDLTPPVRREGVAASVNNIKTAESSENDDSFSFSDIGDGDAVVEILWSESEAFEDGEILSFAVANTLFASLDSEQRINREKEYWTGSWYDKTRFNIYAKIDGEEYTYSGRYDIGDGDGALIEHLETINDWYLKEYESDDLDGRKTLIPYLRKLCDTAFDKEISETDDQEEKIKSVITHNPDFRQEEFLQETFFSEEYEQDGSETVIREELLIGSGFAGGKERIERFYTEKQPDKKAFSEMLKKEYGIGGHSGKGDVRFVNHNGKGISISFNNGKKISLTWNEIAERISKLIDNGEYQGIPDSRLKAEKLEHEIIQKYNNVDKYYINSENESITQVYYNPDSSEGGQLVYNYFSFDDLKEAFKKDDPLDYISQIGKVSLIDISSESFIGSAESFLESKENFNSRDTSAINKLIDILVEFENTEKEVAPASQTAQTQNEILTAQKNVGDSEQTQDNNQSINGGEPNNFTKPSVPQVPVNFHLDENINIDYASGEKAKYRDNIAAIRTLLKIEKEKRFATAEEQGIMSKYVGWGGLAKAFDKGAANWEKEYIELKALLSGKEYEAALNSTLTAFYTDPNIIRPVYRCLERFGFKSGEILDPAMGTGNFFSVIPENISEESHLYGVELDSITGRIAKQLYPNADIRIQGFEYTGYEDNTFDIAVGNVPFENYRVSDNSYSEEYILHDYFFIKALDKLKPGGIAAFITSSGTLDKYSNSARVEIANRAELIGAVRLPNNAFKEIAGAKSVTTDIIFLKKREQPKSYEMDSLDLPDWARAPEDFYNRRGDFIGCFNLYYHTHPEMVLGEHKIVKSAYGMNLQCLPQKDVELIPALETALGALKAEFTAEPTVIVEENIEDIEESGLPAPNDSQNYCFYVDSNNSLYYRENDLIFPYETKSVKAENAIKAMCGLSEELREVIDVQLKGSGDFALRNAQKKLEEKYDEFVKEYGYLNNPDNSKLFREDMRSSLLLSLEEETEETEINGIYKKAEIFTKATISPSKYIESVDTAQEALAVSLNLKNKVDIPYIARLCGKSEEEVITDLGDKIYQNPAGYDGSPCSGWETAEEYLSGYVKDKLGTAMQFAEQYPNLFDRNVTALKENQPLFINISDIDFSVGAVYIPADMYRDFIYETFETPLYYRVIGSISIGKSVDVEYSGLLNQWKITNKSVSDSITISQVYGTDRLNAYEIMESSLNQKRVAVKDPVEYINQKGDKAVKYVLNVNETQIARARQTKIEAEFRNWVLKSPERIERIERIYNDRFNNIKVREYDGSYITIPGLNPLFKFRPHQLNAIARIASGNNVMLAHEVGAGKTAVMAGAGMYLRSIGAAKKPLYIVPKPIVAQWGREFARFFPAAKVLVTDEKDFEKSNRRRFLGKIAAGDFDAVIMSHSQFEKIPLSLERQEAIFNDKKAQLMAAKEKARASDGKRAFSVKQYASAIKALDKKLTKLRADFKKDSFMNFEQLGCDCLFVDEAHIYKNLYTATKHTNVAGINSSANSQRAFDMDMKAAYFQEINNGGGVTMATGTPLSNSIAECYVFQHFLQRPMLQKSGIDSFDEWASVYGNITVSLEVKPTGNGWRMRERFAEFKNLPELCNMLSQCFDVVKTTDIEGIKLPEIIGGKPQIIVCEQSADQVRQVEEGMKRAENIENKKVSLKDDNMLAVCGYMSNVSLDPRINDPDAEDWDGLKINVCAVKICEIQKQFPNSAQVVFCDLSVPNNKGKFTVYQALKDKLIESGSFLPEEIAFVHDADNDRKRLEMFDKVNSGTIKVIIGSTSKLGTGVNMQRNLIAAHHLDAPYVPKDIEQRNGRIVRQGNTNSEVFVNYYSTKGTFDSYRWQLLEKKQRLISQVLSGKAPSRSCQDIDETALTFAEMKAATSDNPLIAEKMQTDNEVDRLKLLQTDWLSQQSRYKSDIEVYLPSNIEKLNKKISKLDEDIALLNDNQLKSQFEMQVGDVRYAERTEAGNALIDQFNKYLASDKYKSCEPSGTVGKFRGFDIEFYAFRQNATVRLTGKSGFIYDNTFTLTSIGICIKIENLVNSIPDRKQAAIREIEKTEKEIEIAKMNYGKPFEYADEFERLMMKKSEIDSRLEFGKVQEVIVDEGDEWEEEEMVM